MKKTTKKKQPIGFNNPTFTLYFGIAFGIQIAYFFDNKTILGIIILCSAVIMLLIGYLEYRKLRK